MLFSLYAATLLSALGASHAQLFEPQEVLEFQSSMLKQFSEYTAYRGPTAPVEASWAIPTSVPLGVNGGAAEWPYDAPGYCSYWMESINHQGKAAFNSNPSGYQVFRNVKDFGAKGDGVTDDTAAIQSAISSGGRCAPGSCQSTTVTPAVVYFPAGTYVVSSTIIDYYYTQIIGNPNCLPVIKPTANFAVPAGSIGVIDGDPYGNSGDPEFGATNIFWRQIRNFVIDMTSVPASSSLAGVHWPTGQATSLQNIIFNMNADAGTQHVGMFIEAGSGGFLNDLVFNGGAVGLNVGNQQFTMRNLTFNGVTTAVNQIWDWGWTYQGININNCQAGFVFNNSNVGSMTILDSSITNTDYGFVTSRSFSIDPPAANSLVMENIKLSGVPTALQGPSGTIIGNVATIAAYAAGNAYTPNGPNAVSGNITPNSRPASLITSDGKYYTRSKPSYANLGTSSFLSARDAGCAGDGTTDDTAKLQAAINSAVSQGKVLYVDHGDYLVTSTIYIPAGSKIVGEAYSVILSSGSFFNSQSTPQPVVQIGKPGETGSIEWSDMIVSTQGQQQGAILFQYNLAAPSGSPSGLWDVHARIGGFAGSNLQLSQCPKTPDTTITSSNLNQNCISGFLTMHITQSSSGLYLENVWLWVADHDVEDPSLTQITIYAGRGLLDESTSGPVWLVGTAVEHHSLYEYQYANAANVFQGQIQTETAYYQPNPNAQIPWSLNAAYNDPVFLTDYVTDNNTQIPSSDGWGLRILNSNNIYAYGAGHYSFFNNYSTSCSDQGNGVKCQDKIVSIEGNSSPVSIYNLNTVGTHWPITVDGTNVAYWPDNQDDFVQTIALFRK